MDKKNRRTEEKMEKHIKQNSEEYIKQELKKKAKVRKKWSKAWLFYSIVSGLGIVLLTIYLLISGGIEKTDSFYQKFFTEWRFVYVAWIVVYLILMFFELRKKLEVHRLEIRLRERLKEPF